MIEVWTRDEYGQASLQGRFKNCEEALSKAYSVLESLNSDNALTSNERERNWECYMPVIKESPKLLYAGKKRGTVHTFVCSDTGEETSSDNASIVLGMKGTSHWVAKNHKNKDIESLKDQALNMKSFIFFKKI